LESAFRSTLTYGYVNLDNASGQADTFYHSSHYASANLVWQLRKRLSVGLEGLYGMKEAATAWIAATSGACNLAWCTRCLIELEKY
jgi:hypothetical protein